MNAKKPKELRKIPLALLSSLVVVVAIAGGLGLQQATSQNATTTAGATNQTGGTTTQNQTSTALVNLTRSDFDSVTSAMNSARESLTQNATEDAYFSLNFADNALFRTAQEEGPSATAVILQMSQPVRNHIDGAQKALIGGDTPRALNELNSADVELVKITQRLPPGEEESSAEED
jgi:hypothetical protein